MDLKIRFVTPLDIPGLLNVYREYIHTPITFEYDLPTPRDFARRVETIAAEYPYLVVEADGTVEGYAYAHRMLDRIAYQWNAELSIYLSARCTGMGVGKLLYLTLFEILRAMRVHTVFGLVTTPNPASEGLHASLGFERLALHPRDGFKGGKWHDVTWFRKELLPFENTPKDLRPVSSLPEKTILGILEKAQKELN